jgi:hypothetical protein
MNKANAKLILIPSGERSGFSEDEIAVPEQTIGHLKRRQ